MIISKFPQKKDGKHLFRKGCGVFGSKKTNKPESGRKQL